MRPLIIVAQLCLLVLRYLQCDAFSKSKPNFIIIMSDDQDLELGSPAIMNNLHTKIIQNGITFRNSFISTPICCPSRSETVTGRYFHNVGAPNGSCMHVDADSAMFNSTSMFQQFQQHGYTTGIFGKFVQNKPARWCPSNDSSLTSKDFIGYDRVFSMCGAANYYQPKYIDKQANNTWSWTNFSLQPSTYQTAQIGNKSIDWIHSLESTNKPFLMWVGPHAPHEPAYPAPWYADHEFTNASMNNAPRTVSYNAYNDNKHGMVANNPALTEEAGELIDELWRDRLKTLLSVDDVIGAVYELLEYYDIINNTYVYYSSDHGYHLGQFRVPCFKAQPYETDVRVPAYMTGPGIEANVETDMLVGNVDVYPTFLELAGIGSGSMDDINEEDDGDSLGIDGKSFAALFAADRDSDVVSKFMESWRDTYLVEYRATGTTYFWICGIWAPDPVTKSVFPGVTIAPPQGPPDMNVTGPWYVNDHQSSNFRMIRVLNSSHNLMYAEFVNYNWTQEDLQKPIFYEFYDLNQDPYQLFNVYGDSSEGLKSELQSMLRTYGSCQGDSCR